MKVKTPIVNGLKMKLLILTLSIATLLTGCSQLKNGNVSSYDVNCSKCTVQMKFDIEKRQKHLDIKGL